MVRSYVVNMSMVAVVMHAQLYAVRLSGCPLRDRSQVRHLGHFHRSLTHGHSSQVEHTFRFAQRRVQMCLNVPTNPCFYVPNGNRLLPYTPHRS